MVTLNPSQTQPVIGISGSSSSSKSVLAMMAQVRAQGGIPMLLSDQIHRKASDDLKKIDALMVMGNDGDIDPSLYTDKYAANDARHAVHNKTNNENAADIPHYTPVIPVDINKDSRLGKIAGEISTIYRPAAPADNDAMAHVTENSFHHQAVDGDKLNKNFRAVAYSDHFKDANSADARLVEAFEPAPDGKLTDWKMLSVQWHPEFGASPLAPKLIENLVENGREAALTKPHNAFHDNAVAGVESLRSHGHPSFVQNEMNRRQAFTLSR